MLEATAKILSATTEGQAADTGASSASDLDLSGRWILYRLSLRVEPQGDVPFEVEVHAKLHRLRMAGDTVPVLYDPADHTKVVVDADADLKALTDGFAAAETFEQEWGGKYDTANLDGANAEVDALMAKLKTRQDPS